MTREELLVERITYITKIALGEELNNMLGIEVDKDFNEAILQASIKAAKVGMKFADQHPHWISVEDEEPPKGQWIITYEPTSPIVVGTDIILPDETADEHHITHWMPLPQDPFVSNPSDTGKKSNFDENCEKYRTVFDGWEELTFEERRDRINKFRSGQW